MSTQAYKSPDDFRSTNYVKASDLATSRRPFRITAARIFAGQDRKGNPVEKIAFTIHMRDTGEEHTLTLGSTPMRVQMYEYLKTPDFQPIGWCVLSEVKMANGQKLWVFDDWTRVVPGGTQVDLPLDEVADAE